MFSWYLQSYIYCYNNVEEHGSSVRGIDNFSFPFHSITILPWPPVATVKQVSDNVRASGHDGFRPDS
jgi:hypothetical protein